MVKPKFKEVKESLAVKRQGFSERSESDREQTKLRSSSSQSKSHNPNSPQAIEANDPQPSSNVSKLSISVAPLTDEDYEFLFEQLSQGIAHGWHQQQIAKFFIRLKERGEQLLWIEWLKRFQTKLLATSPEYKREIGTMMMSFGNLTHSIPEVGQIGTVASKIGRRLLLSNYDDVVWEYDGADRLEVAAEDLEKDELASNTERDLSANDEKTKDRELVFEINLDTPAENAEKTISEFHNSDDEVISDSVPTAEASVIPNSSVSEVTDTKLQPSDRSDIPEVSYSENVVSSSIELVKNWFYLGIRQAIAGEFERAVASWDCALELNPNLSEAWHNRGSALGHLGKYAEAVASFERALVIDSNNYQAWNGHAHALYLLQKWLEAASSWQKAIEIVPDNYLYWFNRARALERLKSFEESLVSYQKALEIKPDFQAARSRYLSLVRENSGTN